MDQINESEPENFMEVNWDNYVKAYYGKHGSAKTWSGFDMQEIYTPKDRQGGNF